MTETKECSVRGCGNKTENQEVVGQVRLNICDRCIEEDDKPWMETDPREKLYKEETEQIIHAIRNRGDQRIGQFLLNAVNRKEHLQDMDVEDLDEARKKGRSQDWARLWNIEAYELLELLKEKDMDAGHVKSIDEVFSERNQLVKALFKALHSLGVDVGYRVDDSEEWLVWTIPEQEHGMIKLAPDVPGQMGWHIHRDEINPEELDWMREIETEYDGHTTEDKHARLHGLVKSLRKIEVNYE